MIVFLVSLLAVSGCSDKSTTVDENRPPSVPTDAAAEVLPSGWLAYMLSWSCSDPDGDSLTFDVYFGSDSTPPLVCASQPAHSYRIDSLQYDTKYYWYVVARDDHGHTTSSPTWYFTTLGSPSITLSPRTLDFESDQTTLGFSITYNGTDTVSWVIVTDRNWIEINPTEGSTSTEADEVNVTVERRGLGPGDYNGLVTVTSDTEAVFVDVRMTIPTDPTLAVFPRALDFGNDRNAVSFAIVNTGSGTLDWSITADKNWIAAQPSTGSTTTEVDSITVTVDLDGLGTGLHAGTVTIASNGGAVTIPVSVEVTAVLSGGQVTPGSGHTDDVFNYEVTFQNLTSELPISTEVVINSTAYSMSKVSGSIDTGALYRLQMSLEEGSHKYYFRFTDARGAIIAFPEDAYFVGPLVTEDPHVLIDEDVIVIDQQDGISLAGTSGTTYTFTISDHAPQIAVGDVILGSDGHGYLRKVSGIDLQDDQIIVETSDAELTDAIVSCDLDTSVSLIDASLTSLGTQGQFSETWNLGGVTLTYDGNVAYGYDCQVELMIAYGKIERFTVTASGDVALTAFAALEGRATIGPESWEINSIPQIRHDGFWLIGGWFPVFWTFSAKSVPGIEVSGEIHASARFQFDGTGSATIGAHWIDDEWSTKWERPNIECMVQPFSWEAGASLRVNAYLKGVVALTLYWTAGPYLEVVPYVCFQGEVEIKPPPEPPYCHWELTAGINGGLGILMGGVPTLGPLTFEGPKYTLASGDCVSPTVISTSPPTNASGVSVNTSVSATFSMDMDTTSITTSTFVVNNGVTGSVSYDQDSRTATFTPFIDLDYETVYTATVTTGVQSVTGIYMKEDHSWSFVTSPAGTWWQPTFSNVNSQQTSYSCSEQTGCPWCPNPDNIWFLCLLDCSFGFETPILVDLNDGAITHSSTGWMGRLGYFTFEGVSLTVSGTHAENIFNFQMTFTGLAVYDSYPRPFDQPGPFEAVFTVQGATLQDGVISGNFELNAAISTPQGNCVTLLFRETSSGTVAVQVSQASSEQAHVKALSSEIHETFFIDERQ